MERSERTIGSGRANAGARRPWAQNSAGVLDRECGVAKGDMRASEE